MVTTPERNRNRLLRAGSRPGSEASQAWPGKSRSKRWRKKDSSEAGKHQKTWGKWWKMMEYDGKSREMMRKMMGNWEKMMGTWTENGENDGNMMGTWTEHKGKLGNMMGTWCEIKGKWWEHEQKMMGTWWEHHENMMGKLWKHDGSMKGKCCIQCIGIWPEHHNKWKHYVDYMEGIVGM